MSNDKLEAVRAKSFLTLDEAAKLHGHKGPFLVLGYKIGEHVVKMVKPKDEFSLYVKAYIPFKPPFSCILDGLQCSTKCTLGKRSIECVDSNDMKMVFECKDDGKRIHVWLKKEVVEEALKCEDLKMFAEKLEKSPIEQLMEKMEIE